MRGGGGRLSTVTAAAVLRPYRLATPPTRAPRLALLGTGTVGSAFIARCARLREDGFSLPDFAWLCNSRALVDLPHDAGAALAELRAAPPRHGGWSPWVESAGVRAGDIVVDATASDIAADWHAEWLVRGIHVVTANKLGRGASLARSRAIDDALAAGGARYGDSATVGAGLPLLRSIRALVAGGDRIERIGGVLSGSLAWLFDRYDGRTPFSTLVREARAAGLTEPDPRIDLSGEDVRRKLLILARAAGIALHAHQVEVASLLPTSLRRADPAEADARLVALDASLRARWRQAQVEGARLCVVGDVDADGARVGLRSLPAGHPLLAGRGTDNRVAIHSTRYREQPLLVQGPGAGAEVTAAALLDDVLALVA